MFFARFVKHLYNKTFSMPRLVVGRKNFKNAINQQARRDLKELELARRQADLLGHTKKRLSVSDSRPLEQRAASSSDDDSDAGESIPKIPRLLISKVEDDDVLVVGEFINPKTTNHLQLNLTTNVSAEDDFFKHSQMDNSDDPRDIVAYLTEEIELEHKEEVSEGPYIPKVTGFEIITTQAEVKLLKNHGNKQLQVVFNVNNSLYFTSDEATSQLCLPPFTVEVVKDTGRLCFKVILDETELTDVYDIRIESFCFLRPNEKMDKDESRIYQSLLSNCSNKMHGKLTSYLRELGINRRFCSELINFATHYEHHQYVNLLSNVKEFI